MIRASLWNHFLFPSREVAFCRRIPARYCRSLTTFPAFRLLFPHSGVVAAVSTRCRTGEWICRAAFGRNIIKIGLPIQYDGEINFAGCGALRRGGGLCCGICRCAGDCDAAGGLCRTLTAGFMPVPGVVALLFRRDLDFRAVARPGRRPLRSLLPA